MLTGMNAPLGNGRNDRPFQFRLRTMMAAVVGIAAPLGILRLLGPDAPVAVVLIIAALFGAALGHIFRRRLRGAIVGALLPVLYLLSIEVLLHVGHRAGWPSGTLRLWEHYSWLWYGHPHQPVGSDGLWKAFRLWDTWGNVLRVQYGNGARIASSCSRSPP